MINKMSESRTNMLHSQYSSVSEYSQDSVFGRTQSIDGSFMRKTPVKNTKINAVFNRNTEPSMIFNKSFDEGLPYG